MGDQRSQQQAPVIDADEEEVAQAISVIFCLIFWQR